MLYMLEHRGGANSQPEDTTDFSFDSTATHLGIPKENLDNQAVREFVGLYNRVQQLQLDLSAASTTHLRRSRVGELFGTPADELEQESGEVGGMNPTLSNRYGRAELLMRVAMELLSDGFQGEPAHPDYVRSKLNAAVNGLGLEVTESTDRPDSLDPL